MIDHKDKFYKISRINANESAITEGYTQSLFAQEPAKIAFAGVQKNYLSWDEFRKKSWSTENAPQIWGIVQISRSFQNHPLPIKDKDGRYYQLDRTRHAEFLHEIDLEFGGTMLGISGLGPDRQKQIIRRNLIEESIASSKLEGANTSRETARRMLREGRKPNDKSERMIANNHAVMTRIEDELKSQPMTMELLMELHKQLTNETLSDKLHEGKIRETLNQEGNRLVIKPWDQTTVAYVTPDKEFVLQELPRLIAYANDADGTTFIHPLIKAITIHFWLGLLHPFEDGNGRLARILFYWYVIRKGYWAFSYLSLSERIIKSPKQYAMAFIKSEQDNYDLNYFVQYNIEKLQLARKQLQSYLEVKLAEEKNISKLTQTTLKLNMRQSRLLHLFSRDIEKSTTPTVYKLNNPAIGHVTAATDLRDLVDKGFLTKMKNGREVNYFPTEKVKALFG
jgi:Fic family protein